MGSTRRSRIAPVVWLTLICVWLFGGLIAAASLGGLAALIVLSLGFLVVILLGISLFIVRLTAGLGDRSCPQCGAAVPRDRTVCPRCGHMYASAGASGR